MIDNHDKKEIIIACWLNIDSSLPNLSLGYIIINFISFPLQVINN